jgi:hypothetical protein
LPRSIVGDRHQKDHGEDERHAEAQQAFANESPGPVPTQGGIDEQAGDEEHQRHKKHVVEILGVIEKQPARGVDHRGCRLKHVLLVEAGERGVGERAVMCDHHQRQGGAQIVDREVAGANCRRRDSCCCCHLR